LQTNSASAVSYQVCYDAFGNQKSTAGAPSSPFGFVGAAGYQQDSDSGLMLLGHRYYDPSTGRLPTRDPAKDGGNWHDYCQNSPLALIDPNGHCFFLILGIIAAAVAVYGIVHTIITTIHEANNGVKEKQAV